MFDKASSALSLIASKCQSLSTPAFSSSEGGPVPLLRKPGLLTSPCFGLPAGDPAVERPKCVSANRTLASVRFSDARYDCGSKSHRGGWGKGLVLRR